MGRWKDGLEDGGRMGGWEGWMMEDDGGRRMMEDVSGQK